ncbi:MAG: DUF11 domain-containing protein [Pirellulales bacterium]|nr:DUF11 domain-containing protein [Pirellulales bacterium]
MVGPGRHRFVTRWALLAAALLLTRVAWAQAPVVGPPIAPPPISQPLVAQPPVAQPMVPVAPPLYAAPATPASPLTSQCLSSICPGGSCSLGSCSLGPCCGPRPCQPKTAAPPKPKQPNFRPDPNPLHEQHRPAGIFVSPRQVIAPVGSEVVVLAGLCDHESHLIADENVEWLLAPGGVGQFMQVGRRNSLHYLNIFTAASEKVDNSYAIGTTSSKYVCLTRGTPTLDDDVAVLKGQSWVTVSSPVEGTSFVTAFGPEVYGWDRRQQTAQIHWVDAQWQFPPAAVNPVGTRHIFTTVISKATNRQPVQGWRVRYEIVGGPEAGFAPGGAKIAEVASNELGQASVEIFQQTPTPGTNQIAIQIIRPNDTATGAQRLILGTGSTTKTWGAPDISLRHTGPAQAAVGALASYRIEVNNPGGATVRDVVISEELPPGLTFESGNPPPGVQGQRLIWRLGDLPSQQSRLIDINLRVAAPGTFNLCAALASADGVGAQDCVSTTVMTTSLDVRMLGPDTAQTGQDVAFQVSVTNGGNTPLSGLKIVDRFDAGFQHAVAANPLERDLGVIEAGQTQTVAITLRAVQAGQQCNSVDVVGAGGILGSARKCVTVAAAPGGPPPPPTVPPGVTPTISVTKTGPASVNVGEMADFDIYVKNTGTVTVNELKVADNYDLALDPVQATRGYSFVGDDIVWLIDTLPPGKDFRLQIRCRCQKAIGRACNRVTVTTREEARADSEACLEIRPGQAAPPAQPGQPAASNLQVTIVDLRDPVAAGREVDYEVRVTNRGTTPDQQVRVTVSAPLEMTPLGPGTSGPARADLVGQRVEFRPFPQLEPNATLTYRVRMRAQRAGTVRVGVQVTSQGMPRGASADTETTIVTGP